MTGKTYFFPCNAWLKKEGDDISGLRKELIAGSADSVGEHSIPSHGLLIFLAILHIKTLLPLSVRPDQLPY